MASKTAIANALAYQEPEMFARIVRDLAIAKMHHAEAVVNRLKQQLELATVQLEDAREASQEATRQYLTDFPGQETFGNSGRFTRSERIGLAGPNGDGHHASFDDHSS